MARIKRKVKSSNKTSHKGNWKAIAIALYLTFLLLSMIPLTADRVVEPEIKDSYTYHLRYSRDGRQTHYYVERVNTSRVGTIDLTYTTKTNTLVVDSENIKVLYVYCRSMYDDECQKVYGFDPVDNSNYYKWYFIEKNHFHVVIDSDNKYEELKFIDTPFAYKVVVNDNVWTKDSDYFYEEDQGMALSDVPNGHTIVDLYFKPPIDEKQPPTAVLKASQSVVPLNKTVIFDGSQSFDQDGFIAKYFYDFGDGKFDRGKNNTHQYSKPGVYGVIFMVRDNDDLVDYAFVNITVKESTDLPQIQNSVPNQIKPEDSPPWMLNLSIFEPVPGSPDIEYYWYLTGENQSLYSLSGENDTNSRFIFAPEPDAFGNDLVTLWLHSSEGLYTNQLLWINITSVNDLPSLLALPDLIVHYDEPYTFNFQPYMYDKETPIHELILEIYDGFENQYITVNGFNATFIYPHSKIGENIYATIKISDGEDSAQDVISIQVTSDYVPELVKNLPDVWLFEGTTKYNVFDLDDYFVDPDNDAIYFSYGQTHLTITIQQNHSVDISTESEWTGVELVTFRARDPIGALAEDSIVVTVLPVNDPPTISGVPDFVIRYDHNYRFELTPYVHDNDNLTSELRIIASDPEHITIDKTNHMVIILNYPKDYLGQTFSMRLTVTDGLESGFQDVTIKVTEDFPPELISPLPDITFLEDHPLLNGFDLDNYFLDLDGDVLYYTAGNKFINITINDDHHVDFSASPNWYGSEHVYFRATDPTGALQEDLIIVTVLPVNDPPELLQIPPQYGNESERWVLDLEPYIIDVDNDISELEISIDNDFIIISGKTLIFFGSNDLPDQVKVSVSDGESSISQTIDIHLKLSKPPKSPTLVDLFINILPFLIIIILITIGITGLIYRKKTRFTVDEVFLIHTGGTLINHLLRGAKANVDDVIFSGMFTAVQEFIKDTFVKDNGQEIDNTDNQWLLDELKLGDNNILIERGRYTYLAVIFSGGGSRRLRKIVKKLVDKIEMRYEYVLPKWDGNMRELAGTKEILSVLIKEVDRSKDKPQKDSGKRNIVSKTQGIPKIQELSSQQHNTKNASVKSTSLTQAQPVSKPKTGVTNIRAQKRVNNQAGKNRLELQKIPMGKDKYRGISDMANIELDKLSTGVHNYSNRKIPKSTIIKKRRINIKSESNSIHKKGSSDSKGEVSTTIKIKMPGSNKDMKIDTSRSLLQQFAEFMDEDGSGSK